MAGERITVEGVNKLSRELKAIDAALPAELKQINREAAENVAKEARNLVPVRSGKLLASIKAGASVRAGTVSAGGLKAVPYAAPIHFGWGRRHIHPQPFIYDALDRHRDEVFAAYEKNLSSLIDKVMGGDSDG